MLALAQLPLATPAFVYDECHILSRAQIMAQAGRQSGCKMLYSIKALPFLPVLELLKPWVDGFSVSSLFEAKLAAPMGLPLHLTTPGLREAEIAEIGALCQRVAFNSWQQFIRLRPLLGETASSGIRINPGWSCIADRRYDPCRLHSKLGIPLAELSQRLTEDPVMGQHLKGLHFHTAHASSSFEPLRHTLARIEAKLDERFLSSLEWINLGGGYLFDTVEDLAELACLVREWQACFGVEVLFEPGKGLVGRAGYLVATVLDRFDRDGKAVAVLDTTINHHPELFEYQRRPEPGWLEPEPGQAESVILAGCTCLAGDVFGEFRFAEALAVGDRVVFAKLGAYSLIKANRFNGVNLPTVYAWDGASGIRRLKTYGFAEYQAAWSADPIHSYEANR